MRDRLALFLLDGRGAITAVAWQGRLLSQHEALELWRSESWQPARAGQQWPMDHSRQVQQEDQQQPTPMWSS